MSFFTVDNSMPTPVVLTLVILAVFWGLIVACYIADIAWIFCFARQAAEAKKQAVKQRIEMMKQAALSRNPVFIIGDRNTYYEEASRQLIRAV